jgi:hypothetical protein
MTSAESARTRGVFSSLWMRAPLWRACVLMAFLSTTVALLYPPTMRKAQLPALPVSEQVAYQLPPEAVAPGPVVAQPTVAQPAVIAAASAVTKQPEKSSMRRARVDVPHPQTASVAPANAQISLSLPGSPVGKDPSGLDTGLMGRTYSRSIVVDGFEVPLPPGQWAMLANSSVRVRNASGMFYFLGRIERKRLVGGLKVLALKTPDKAGDGFPAIRGCVAGNPGLNYVFVESITPFDHQACWTVSNYFTPPWQQWADRATRIESLDRAAAGDMAAKGITYPQDFVAIRFSRSEKSAYLEATYLFDPELEGLSSTTALSFGDSDWHVTNINRFPDKLAYVEKLKGWAEIFWSKFQQAFAAGE